VNEPGARVVLTGDDFGRSPTINAAIVRTHLNGVLTSASLAVTGESAGEAVRLARENPGLAVGLHLVLADGRPALPVAEVPHLVDSKGRFPPDPFAAGLKYFFAPGTRAELAREIEAQFRLFDATGLPLSHVDGHMNLHLHPAVLPVALRLAVGRGARGFRIPRDDLGLSLRHGRRHLVTRVTWALTFGLLSRWARRRVRGLPLVVPDRVYGLLQSGCMTLDYVLAVLGRLAGRPLLAELYFHPDVAGQPVPFGPNRDDFATLTAPAVRRAFHELALSPATYLEGARKDCRSPIRGVTL